MIARGIFQSGAVIFIALRGIFDLGKWTNSCWFKTSREPTEVRELSVKTFNISIISCCRIRCDTVFGPVFYRRVFRKLTSKLSRILIAG